MTESSRVTDAFRVITPKKLRNTTRLRDPHEKSPAITRQASARRQLSARRAAIFRDHYSTARTHDNLTSKAQQSSAISLAAALPNLVTRPFSAVTEHCLARRGGRAAGGPRGPWGPWGKRSCARRATPSS